MSPLVFILFFGQMPIIYFLLKKVILPKLGIQDPKNQFSVMFAYFSGMAIIAIAYWSRNYVLDSILLLLLWPLETFVPNYVAKHMGWPEDAEESDLT